jgi:hypothetical protein
MTAMPFSSNPNAADIAWWRQAIHDACLRFARGCDRLDRDLLLSAFAPEAVVDYTVFTGGPAEFADWVIPMLRDNYTYTTHFNTNHYVEFNAEHTRAFGETYVMAVMRFQRNGRTFDLEGMGRYFDVYAPYNGQWRIISRRTISDWERIVAVSSEQSELVKAVGLLGRRDTTDPSYAHLAQGSVGGGTGLSPSREEQ